jgi:hypothetical protein
MQFGFAFRLSSVIFVVAMALAIPSRAQEIYVAQETAGEVSTYSAFSGALFNAEFISGIPVPRGLTLSGGNLYVSGHNVAQYNIANGTTINSTLITGVQESQQVAVGTNNLYVTNTAVSGGVEEYTLTGTPVATPLIAVNGANGNGTWGVALSGNDLFVAITGPIVNGHWEAGAGSVAEYNATTGALIDASFITGLNVPETLQIVGSNLYVTNNADTTIGNNTLGSIGVYDLTTGDPINAALVTGLNQPAGIAIYGNDLYVTSNPVNGPQGQPEGIIGEYNATTGATINASLVTGLNDPQGLLVLAPEPSTWVLLAIGAAALLARIVRRRAAG